MPGVVPRKGDPRPGAYKYSGEFKKFVVKYAAEVGNQKASDEFGIDRSMIRRWKSELKVGVGADSTMAKERYLPETTEDIKKEIASHSKTVPKFKNTDQRDLAAEKEFHLQTLQKLRERRFVNFRDFEEVADRTEMYFTACFECGVVPSVMGLATRGYGINKEGLMTYLDNHHDDISVYIRNAIDVMADIITDNGYKDMKAITMSIFQLKNHYGHADRVEVRHKSAKEEKLNISEITQRYTNKGVVLEPMKEVPVDADTPEDISEN